MEYDRGSERRKRQGDKKENMREREKERKRKRKGWKERESAQLK